MKTKEQIELEIEKVILEMQEIGEEDEAWDVRNGWVNALRWTLKEGEGEGEGDKCANSYELSSRDNRCGDCGNCSTCCTHESEGE